MSFCSLALCHPPVFFLPCCRVPIDCDCGLGFEYVVNASSDTPPLALDCVSCSSVLKPHKDCDLEVLPQIQGIYYPSQAVYLRVSTPTFSRRHAYCHGELVIKQNSKVLSKQCLPSISHCHDVCGCRQSTVSTLSANLNTLGLVPEKGVFTLQIVVSYRKAWFADEVAETVVVPKNYPTIQDAINAVPSGTTINIVKGTYYEALTVSNKILTLRGCCDDDVILTQASGSPSAPTLTETNAHVTLQNIQLTNTTGAQGVQLTNESIVSLQHSRVFDVGLTAPITLMGAGINAMASSVYIDSCSHVSNNRSQADGGGIALDASSVLVSEGTIDHNLSAGIDGGGGIYSEGIVVLNKKASVDHNVAAEGGGIVNHGGSLTMNDDSSVCHNRGTFQAGGIISELGSAGPSQRPTVTLNHNARIAFNFTPNNGGGIYSADTTLTLNDNMSIDHNLANDGGGIYVGSSTTPLSSVTYVGVGVTSGGIRDNTAGEFGGGIYIESGTLLLGGTALVSSNVGGESGGGIYNNNGAVVMNDSASVVDNVTFVFGGGISNPSTAFVPSLSFNSSTTRVTGNQAFLDEAGGVFSQTAVFGISPSIVFSNFAPSCPQYSIVSPLTCV